jgi:hypothetical protein
MKDAIYSRLTAVSVRTSRQHIAHTSCNEALLGIELDRAPASRMYRLVVDLTNASSQSCSCYSDDVGLFDMANYRPFSVKMT